MIERKEVEETVATRISVEITELTEWTETKEAPVVVETVAQTTIHDKHLQLIKRLATNAVVLIPHEATVTQLDQTEELLKKVVPTDAVLRLADSVALHHREVAKVHIEVQEVIQALLTHDLQEVILRGDHHTRQAEVLPAVALPVPDEDVKHFNIIFLQRPQGRLLKNTEIKTNLS